MGAEEALVRQRRLCQLVGFVYQAVVVSLLRPSFYLTETERDWYHIAFFRKQAWDAVQQAALRQQGQPCAAGALDRNRRAVPRVAPDAARAQRHSPDGCPS